ncbi:hypothetical protein Dsin_003175 [Dipteronia sinensis]|uniref:Cytochrome P450 n=1 Tax=Dipteronia sinensis TaxID=43782 RepID=A0AAE0EKD5_9ROSI|nr:hypothetical protein Dsin_003175 [Dipteronia sinensis]
MSSKIRAEEVKFTIKHLYKRVQKIDVESFFYILDFNIMMKIVAGKKCFEEEELDFDKITKGKMHDLKQIFDPLVNMALGDYFPYLRWLTYYGVEKQMIKFTKREMLTFRLCLIHIKIIIIQFQLIAHPEAFKRARDEIDNQVGDSSRLINDADLTKLPYLHCTISEALRLGPVTILPPYESSEDCTVGGYHIPRGTQLWINTWAVHNDPEFWIEHDRFKPERFLIQSEIQEKGGFKFIPFGLGRRVCPEEGLGMRVMALSLGTLIQCFDWEEVKEDQRLVPVKTNPNKAEERHVEIIFRPREALTKVVDLKMILELNRIVYMLIADYTNPLHVQRKCTNI